MSSPIVNKLYPSNHKTIFVLDHTPYFGTSSDFPIELDSSDKSRGPGFIPIAPISKSLWTCVIEAVMEYCRIVWDLFVDRKLIRIIVSDLQAHSLNTWNQEDQTLNYIIQALQSVGAINPSRQNSGDHSILHGLRSALEAMTERTSFQIEKNLISTTPTTIINQTSPSLKYSTGSSLNIESSTNNKIINRCRIICITSYNNIKSIETMISILNLEIDKLNMASMGSTELIPIHYCHLVIINVLTNSNKSNNSIMQYKNVQYSQNLSTELHTVTAGVELANKLSHLIQSHYDLSSTTVTGIPMKEEQNANSSANYDVEIFHPSEVHAALLKGNLADISQVRTIKEGSTYETITLRWSTPRNTVTEMHNCTSMHRITPVDVSSRPSSCLINFLLNGRSVNLEMIRRVGGKVISHMLTSHGGDIFMHTLATGRSILEDPPSISEGYGGRVTDYRITDFGILMRSNKLLPARNVLPGDKLTEKMKKKFERQTLYWPLTISSTYVYNNKQVFEPLLSLVQKEDISDNALIQCNQCIYNLVALEAKHDPVLPNNPGTRGKGPKRDEQYKQMWNELEHLVRINNRSENHSKLLQTLLDFKNKSHSAGSTDEKLAKVDLNQALREFDIIKDAVSPSSGYERASVIRTTDSPMSPPPSSLSRPLKYAQSKGRSLLDIVLARQRQALAKNKRADFYGRLNAVPGPDGTLRSKLYVDLQIKEDQPKPVVIE